MPKHNDPGYKPRVFLCHASEDKSRVKELYHELKEAGYHPWLDKYDLLPGQNWWEEIGKVISDPDSLVMVCLSNNSTKRGVVQKEIKKALDILDEMPEDTIYLIPARLEDCPVPDRLSQLHWVDLFEPNGFDMLKQALDFEINNRQATPEPASRPPHDGESPMGSDLERLLPIVLGNYAVDKGVELEKEVGPEALGMAKEIFTIALDRLRQSPKGDEGFEQAPETYQKPVEQELAELMRADLDFAAKLRAMLEKYEQAAKEHAAVTGGSFQATHTGTGDIVQGQQVSIVKTTGSGPAIGTVEGDVHFGGQEEPDER